MHAMHGRGMIDVRRGGAVIDVVRVVFGCEKFQTSTTRIPCTMVSKQRQRICSIHKLVSRK
jgi:hypothetical protein